MSLKDKIETDVLIVGGGIAGAVLAHTLSLYGVQIVLANKNSHQAKQPLLGESIPPTSIPMLQRLHLEGYLNSHEHFKNYGYQSVWGTDEVQDFPFDTTSDLYGWKINKKVWGRDILSNTNYKALSFQQLDVLQKEGEKSVLQFQTEEGVVDIQAKYLVDSTGRNSYIAKKLGDRRHYSDDLVAYCCNVLLTKNDKVFRPVFIESFEKGWGISSQLNATQTSLTLFTSSKTDLGPVVKNYKNWSKILEKTKVLKSYCVEMDETVSVKGMSAGSSILTKMSGANWLAIGDAAMSFDPLSSHGISTSIYSAELAAKVIYHKLNGNPSDLFASYRNEMRSLYGTYLTEKDRIYSLEKRWANTMFWNN